MKVTLKKLLVGIFILLIAVMTISACDVENYFDEEQQLELEHILGGHEWGEWVTVKEADCKSPGLRERECLDCDRTEEEEIPQGKHNASDWIVDTEPTCKEGSRHTECEACGKVLSTEKIPPVQAHIPGEWTVTDEPDCIHSGKKVITCLECGAWLEAEVLPPTGIHTEGEWEVSEESTCVEQGLQVKNCTVCGVKMAEEALPLSEKHVEGEWIIDREPYGTTEGLRHTECELCGITLSEEAIPVTCLHVESDWIVDTDSTCTEEGSKHVECTVCGDVLYTETIAKHKYVDGNCVNCKQTKETYFIFTYIEETDSYSIKTRSTYSLPDDIVLPKEYNGKPVTAVEAGGFSECEYLDSIVISESITTIGASAFFGCVDLERVTISNSVTSIGENAFENCTSLNSACVSNIGNWCNIKFGNALANPLYYVKGLYLNDELVTELVIPDGVESVGDYAFSDCDNLTSINMPDNVRLGIGAFGTGDETIPDTDETLSPNESNNNPSSDSIDQSSAWKIIRSDGVKLIIDEPEFREILSLCENLHGEYAGSSKGHYGVLYSIYYTDENGRTDIYSLWDETTYSHGFVAFIGQSMYIYPDFMKDTNVNDILLMLDNLYKEAGY